MSLQLSKIEVELWTNENFDRFRKEQMKSYEYEDMKEWQESNILPEYRDMELIKVLDDICKRSGFDEWSDFELHYTDTENGDKYFFSYNSDGDLMEINCNNVANEQVVGQIGFGTHLREIETIPSPSFFKRGN